ncbi:MAG: phenylalanine--tRNA ligase subunit beta [Chloroflexi bacterium]|nr:phenylalanine--tRNA ligase subunit beta [Chloroflexota bacterium]
MRVPLAWLRDYVDVDLEPQALADELTMRGMEVSAIEVAGADWSGVVVGRLLHVERHPNADTLWLTRVDVGEDAGGELEIVCGAQNLEVGQLVPAALPGAVLPGERRIERSKIRGVVSNGMLCSAIELGLGPDADGIHILGHGDEIAPGASVAELVGEVVLDVDVKPNRGDALSMVGLAREIAAFTGADLRLPSAEVSEGDTAADEHVSVRIEDPELNPRFTARWFEGVSNGPSPDWMQRRLLAAGMRPISAVVDVTNYVMHELGQPMHAYDADAVPEGKIVVRRARDGESLETIDHVRRTLDERMLVIADRERPIGLAGIMGGASTEVGDATSRVILESAIFHGPTVRNTARRLGLRSEASARHEKGIATDLPRFAVDRAAKLIAETTGARVGRGIVDNDPDPRPATEVTMGVGRVGRLLGIELDAERVTRLLEPLGFAVKAGGDDALTVTVPPWRLDVTSDADLAEEIARAHGYERIPGRLPRAALPAYRPDPSEPRHRIRRILAGLGLDEMVSHALIGRADIERTGYDPDDPELVRLFNPLSEDHAILRSRMAPSLLGGLAENARWRQPDVRLFDLGAIYGYRPESPTTRDLRSETAGTGRYESWELGIVLAGRAEPASPGASDREVDVADLKGIIDALHDALGAPRPAYRAEDAGSEHAHRHPGRTGLIVDAAGRPYGSLGEVHPRVVAAWGVGGRPVDASLDVGRLLSLVAGIGARSIPAVQPVDRDLAVVVAEGTPVGDLLRVARTSAGPQLVEVHLFDVYRGEQIGAGKVSYAVSFRFQPETAGDTKSIERALNKVRGSLRHHLGAEIR